IPVSALFGRRPSNCFTRLYSSSESPISRYSFSLSNCSGLIVSEFMNVPPECVILFIHSSCQHQLFHIFCYHAYRTLNFLFSCFEHYSNQIRLKIASTLFKWYVASKQSFTSSSERNWFTVSFSSMSCWKDVAFSHAYIAI